MLTSDIAHLIHLVDHYSAFVADGRIALLLILRCRHQSAIWSYCIIAIPDEWPAHIVCLADCRTD